MKSTFPALLLSHLVLFASYVPLDAAEGVDPRNVRFGHVIPDEGYCDQPYVVVTKNGGWLCVLTTGSGKEGDRGQHVVSTNSRDHGRTWSAPIDIEPASGPEASWATPFMTPGGRVYVFYDYNGDDVRRLKGKPVRADMLGWYCYRYSDNNGASWSPARHRIPIRMTACDRANDWRGQVQIFWGISKPIVHGRAMLLTFTKLGKHLLDNGEGWLLQSENLLTEPDPAKLRWELLPDGDHGLRNSVFGSVQEEHSIVPLSDGSLFCIYRTTTGHPCQTYSRDGGHTWSKPEVATYSPGGPTIKHPRACPKLWRTASGKYLLWFHNHSGKSFVGRNPAWILGGMERNGHLYWSQPEILLYDDDPAVRMSYPDLIEQDGRYWVTETQKTVARVHEIDPEILEGCWKQLDMAGTPAPVSDSVLLELTSAQLKGGKVAVPAWPQLTDGQGFSLELTINPVDPATSQVLFDSMDENHCGARLQTIADGALQLTISDGKHEANGQSDSGRLTPGKKHHVVATVDGGPKIITFIIDGVVCDGGPQRQAGWARFYKGLTNINGNKSAQVTPKGQSPLAAFRIHGRPLRNAEAVTNARLFFQAQGQRQVEH